MTPTSMPTSGESARRYPEFHDHIAALMDEHAHITSVDVCGHCGDSECDGVGCIAAFDPNADCDDLLDLHDLLRDGQAWRAQQALIEAGQTALGAWMMADEALAIANNRTVATECEECGRGFSAQGPCDDTCTACRLLAVPQTGGPE